MINQVVDEKKDFICINIYFFSLLAENELCLTPFCIKAG